MTPLSLLCAFGLAALTTAAHMVGVPLGTPLEGAAPNPRPEVLTSMPKVRERLTREVIQPLEQDQSMHRRFSRVMRPRSHHYTVEGITPSAEGTRFRIRIHYLRRLSRDGAAPAGRVLYEGRIRTDGAIELSHPAPAGAALAWKPAADLLPRSRDPYLR